MNEENNVMDEMMEEPVVDIEITIAPEKKPEEAACAEETPCAEAACEEAPCEEACEEPCEKACEEEACACPCKKLSKCAKIALGVTAAALVLGGLAVGAVLCEKKTGAISRKMKQIKAPSFHWHL